MLQDSKIYLITYMHQGCEFVSHGIGDLTLRTYILSQDTVAHFKPKRDYEGWYIDGPTAKEVTVRLMVKDGREWAQKLATMSASELNRVLWDLDGQYVVVVDDEQQVYYCGREDLRQAYLARGKNAKSFSDLERRMFSDCPTL